MDSPEKKTAPVILALAWLVVIIPLGWGVFESVKKSLPLFDLSSAPTVPSAGK